MDLVRPTPTQRQKQASLSRRHQDAPPCGLIDLFSSSVPQDFLTSATTETYASKRLPFVDQPPKTYTQVRCLLHWQGYRRKTDYSPLGAMSSPDPLHLANSDKENTSTSHPVTSATATLSNKPPSSSKVTPASRTSTSTTRGRGRGRSTAGGATRKSAYAVPSSAAVTMYSSPRRSTRARSRSRSTSMSVSAGGSNALQQYLEQDEQDYNDDDGDDTYSIASSSATASRRSNANGERGASARADAKANGNQATTHDAANGTNINIDTSTIDAPGGWNGTTSSPPQSSSARKPTSRSTPKKQAQATDSHLHDLDRVEHDEDPAFRQQSVTQTSHQAMQQRGRGPSILQQSEQPSHASLKDTSVNIATAFRQAAGTKQLDIGANTGVTTLASQSLSTAATIASSSTTTYGNGQKAIASTSSIGFLARAGDREVPLVDTSSSRDKSDQPTSQSMQQNPSTSSSTTSQQQVTPGSAGKKRKARPSKGKAKDTAWKPSKDELANMSTDEYASEGAITTDPEDLTKYIENPWGKKVYKVEYEGNGRRIVRRRQRKKARGENGENDEEDEEEVDEDDEEEVLLDEEDIETNANATASPVTRRRNAATRRDRATAARGKSGRRAAVRSTRHTSVDGSVMSNDDTASQAPSQGGVSVTSYYLHEPAEAGPSSSRAQAQTSTAPTAQKPESQSAEQAGLVQTYSKAGNFQPYFAYSTTKVGNDTGNTSARHGYNSTAPLRARRDTTLSTSTEGANSNTPNQSYASRLLGGDSGRGGPSSTASFDQRGSDYDYAEEEKMTAALLAAKERGSLAKGIPEGRPILPDMLLTRNYGSHPSYRYNQLHLQTNSQKDREMSLSALSDQSSEVQSSQRAANHLEPKRAGYTGLKRAPAPPPRASSVVTESLQHAPGNYASFEASSSMSELNDQPVHEGESFAQRQAKKSLGRRLGEIMRAAFIALYWLIAGPLQWLKKQDANTIWKSAGAVLLAGLIIGEF